MFPEIPYEFGSRTNISRRSAWIFAQNFGAVLAVVVS
jgi:hypothetical protein